jgi:hypothetical protein
LDRPETDISGLFWTLAVPTPRSAHSSLPTSPRRASLTLVLAAIVFACAVAPHGSAAEHRESPSGAVVDRSARHPGAPVHLESSSVELLPGCPLCVLQLQTVTVLKAPRTALPPLTPRGSLAPASLHADPGPEARHRPARAPPVLSSAL